MDEEERGTTKPRTFTSAVTSVTLLKFTFVDQVTTLGRLRHDILFFFPAMVPIVPPEIWLRVAQFIPTSVLRNLYSVNRIFLDLALNERYNDINLAISRSPETTKKLKHLR